MKEFDLVYNLISKNGRVEDCFNCKESSIIFKEYRFFAIEMFSNQTFKTRSIIIQKTNNVTEGPFIWNEDISIVPDWVENICEDLISYPHVKIIKK